VYNDKEFIPQPRVYTIEKILDKKKLNNTYYYLIKWKDYDDSYNTWEPYKQLVKDVPEMVQQYEDSIKPKPKHTVRTRGRPRRN
jgi:hypothetical protein